jgi:arylsulfatase A-like enzyme
VSLIDLTATILDIAGVSTDEQKVTWQVDGDSLLPLLTGENTGWKDEAFVEHNAHGTDRARVMLRQGQWKLCYGHGEPPEFELYNLASDPGEFENLAGRPMYREVQSRLLRRTSELWDGDRVTQNVLRSQRERALIRGVACEEHLF